jgi:hypothetical protein
MPKTPGYETVPTEQISAMAKLLNTAFQEAMEKVENPDARKALAKSFTDTRILLGKLSRGPF